MEINGVSLEVLPLICDIVLAAVLLMALISGWKKGFVSRLVRVFSWLIALLLAHYFYQRLAGYLETVGVTGRIAASLKQALTPEMLPGAGSGSSETGSSSGLLASLLLPGILRSELQLNNTSAVYQALGVDTMLDYVSLSLAKMLMNALSVIVIFTGSLLLLRFVGKHLTFINKIPLVGLVNEVLGAVGELVVAILVLQFVLMVLTSLGTVHPVVAGLLDAVRAGTLGGLLYEHNVFMNWMMSV